MLDTHTHTHWKRVCAGIRLGHGKWKLAINAYYITANRIGRQRDGEGDRDRGRGRRTARKNGHPASRTAGRM